MKKIFAIVLIMVVLFTSFVPVVAVEENTELIITEVCYNSPNSEETEEKDICDYIEILNASDREIDLSGAELATCYLPDPYEFAPLISEGSMKVKPGQIIIISTVADRETFNKTLGVEIDAESFYRVENIELKNSGYVGQVVLSGSEGVYCIANYNPEKHNANKKSVIFGISETQGHHLMGLAAMTPGEIDPELLGLSETKDYTENLKFMTYNICASGVKSDYPGEVPGQEYVIDPSLYINLRYNDIVNFILQESPDVLCLCELNKEWWEVLAPGLTDVYGYWGISSKTGSEADSLSEDKWDTIPLLLYKKDKFKVVEKGSFTCPPDERNLTTPNNWAVLRKNDTRATFMVMTQHLVAGSEDIRHQVRTESAKVITGKIKEITQELPVVVMGDYNCYEGSDAYKIFKESGLKDAARMNPDAKLTDTCFGFEKKQEQIYTQLPIDIFMLSAGDFNVKSYNVLDTTLESGFAYSDHCPVVIEVEMRSVKTGVSPVILVILVALGVGIIMFAIGFVLMVKLKKNKKILSLEA